MICSKLNRLVRLNQIGNLSSNYTSIVSTISRGFDKFFCSERAAVVYYFVYYFTFLPYKSYSYH